MKSFAFRWGFAAAVVVSSAAVGHAEIVLFEETFDGAYRPVEDPDPTLIVLADIGSGALSGISTGTSAASGKALAVTTSQNAVKQSETIVSGLDLSGHDINDLSIEFSLAGSATFRNGDRIAVRVNGFAPPLAQFAGGNSNNNSTLRNRVDEDQVVLPSSTFTDLSFSFVDYQQDRPSSLPITLSNISIDFYVDRAHDTDLVGLDTVRVVSSVPEPVSLALLGIGMIALIGRRRQAGCPLT